jgi:hypothetical protein
MRWSHGTEVLVAGTVPIEACARADSHGLLTAYVGCWSLSLMPNPAWHAANPINTASIANILLMTMCPHMPNVGKNGQRFLFGIAASGDHSQAHCYVGGVRETR